MAYWIGIDGGGSNLRVSVVKSDLSVMHQVQGDGVNPSILGREQVAIKIQETLQQTINESPLNQ